MKLVWELVGSEFAGRHEQYEMFYAGAPFLVKSRMAQVYDFDRATALVDRALAGYDLDGRTDPDTLVRATAGIVQVRRTLGDRTRSDTGAH